MMAGDIAGRERELDSIHAFLDGPVEGPAGLVIEGEAGIGKSTVWLGGAGGGRGGDREIDGLAGGRRGRTRAGLSRAFVAAGGGRARPGARGAGRSVRGRPRRRVGCAVDAEAARARGRVASSGGVG